MQADLSKFISLAGQQHDFKFGFGRQKNVNKVDERLSGRRLYDAAVEQLA